MLPEQRRLDPHLAVLDRRHQRAEGGDPRGRSGTAPNSIILDLRDNRRRSGVRGDRRRHPVHPGGQDRSTCTRRKAQDPRPVNTVPADWLPISHGDADQPRLGLCCRDHRRRRSATTDRSPLIGETTFGTGTVLTPFNLDDGSIVLLGTALWLEPDGEQIWKHGVTPDDEVTARRRMPIRSGHRSAARFRRLSYKRRPIPSSKRPMRRSQGKTIRQTFE